MAKNTGKEYEKLTQSIFNLIVNQNQVNNIDVQHNVVVQGREAKHQIDVFWKFEVAGEEYCAIVQAKDWKSKVPQDAIHAFNDIINDFPYGTRGIFVSLSGYQKGAIAYAKGKGITLYELRPPKSEDWDGYIKVLNLQFNVHTLIEENVTLFIDGEWAKKQRRSDLPNGNDLSYNGEDKFYNKNGIPYTKMETLLRSMLEGISSGEKHVLHIFDQPTYTYVDGKYVKVHSIEADLNYSTSTYVHKIDLEDFVGYVLKNTILGNTRIFNTKDLQIT